jgi:hydrogenase/urease accessory protein HupE
MQRLQRFPALLLRVVPILCLAATAPQAHPNGTSKAVLRLLGNDSLTLEIDANTSTMFNAVSIFPAVGDYRSDTVRLYQRAAAQYALSRVTLKADGKNVLRPDVLRWKRAGKGPEDGIVGDSVALWDTSFVVVYGGRLPAEARRLSFSAALFPEFGAQTICEFSIFWRDTLIERRWLGMDAVLRLPLARDSLDAMLAKTREKPESAAGENLLARFVGLGYVHILPHGLDHILFVLGLFFFSTRMRPLLWQVTAFTLAHSITLAVALLGIISLPGRVVEPLIALSIAVVGLENVFFRKVRASRWLVVFAFGLVHGMGFAGVLSGFGLPEGGFWPALIGFNVGVELGQLSVIAGAFALTVWFRNKAWYFKGIVVPVSLLISAAGLYWAVTRAIGM